jgi:hypothetical protein
MQHSKLFPLSNELPLSRLMCVDGSLTFEVVIEGVL